MHWIRYFPAMVFSYRALTLFNKVMKEHGNVRHFWHTGREDNFVRSCLRGMFHIGQVYYKDSQTANMLGRFSLLLEYACWPIFFACSINPPSLYLRTYLVSGLWTSAVFGAIALTDQPIYTSFYNRGATTEGGSRAFVAVDILTKHSVQFQTIFRWEPCGAAHNMIGKIVWSSADLLIYLLFTKV